MHKLVLTLTAAVTIIGCKPEKKVHQNTETKPVKVETSIAQPEKKVKHLNYTGVITPSSTTPLSFQLPGLVQNIYVSEGDMVKKGQVLATINKETFQSAYNIAVASKKQAKDAHQRLKLVHDQGSLPEIQWQEMLANLTKANASAELARLNLEKCEIVSPLDGVIGRRNVEVGSTATPGITVFDVMTIENVFVRISVPETEIRTIQKGQIGRITIPAVSAEPFTATVENIGVIANQFSKTYEVKLKMANPNMVIKPGMACDIDLTTTSISSEIAVPYSSVIQDKNKKTFVYTVNESTHKVSKQPVEVGLFSNNKLIVTNGLAEGDIIVIEGQQKLHDESLVTIN